MVSKKPSPRLSSVKAGIGWAILPLGSSRFASITLPASAMARANAVSSSIVVGREKS